MDCPAFRELHGDWVDDVLDRSQSELVSQHLADCPACARFDALVRRALMVARSAPPIEVSADFSTRLAARLAEERRDRIAHHAPSIVERPRVVQAAVAVVGRNAGAWTMARRAAAVAIVTAGVMVARSASSGSVTSARTDEAPSAALSLNQASFINAPALGQDEGQFMPASAESDAGMGEIVVLRPMRQVGGALLPISDDPLLDGGERAGAGDISATSVAATAPLWPTAQMAAHAAHRFAAMEFGDIVPVSVVQPQR